MSESTPRRRRNYPYPHGTAIEPQVVNKDDMSDLFVTMFSLKYIFFDRCSHYLPINLCCIHSLFRPYSTPTLQCFFARLGFVQPPTCLKCAHRASGCGDGNRRNKGGEGGGESSSSTTSSCNRLVPWRRDASIALHPAKLEGNISFITCDTAKSLVNGDAYPSIRWDARHKRLLHEV